MEKRLDWDEHVWYVYLKGTQWFDLSEMELNHWNLFIPTGLLEIVVISYNTWPISLLMLQPTSIMGCNWCIFHCPIGSWSHNQSQTDRLQVPAEEDIAKISFLDGKRAVPLILTFAIECVFNRHEWLHECTYLLRFSTYLLIKRETIVVVVIYCI